MPKRLLGSRNVKSLPHVDLRVGQSIGLLKGFHSGVVQTGKSPEGVTCNDNMSAGGGWCDWNHRGCRCSRISRSNSRDGAGIDWCDWLVAR